jgi:hypothetical protein
VLGLLIDGPKPVQLRDIAEHPPALRAVQHQRPGTVGAAVPVAAFATTGRSPLGV